MWPFSRRRPRIEKRFAANAEKRGLRLRVRVIGALRPGYLRVVVAGNGLIDGGEADWPIAWVPEAARRPNGEFVIWGFEDGVPRVPAAEDVERGRRSGPAESGR